MCDADGTGEGEGEAAAAATTTTATATPLALFRVHIFKGREHHSEGRTGVAVVDGFVVVAAGHHH